MNRNRTQSKAWMTRTLHIAVAGAFLWMPWVAAGAQEPAQSEEKQQPAQAEEKQQEEPAKPPRPEAQPAPKREAAPPARQEPAPQQPAKPPSHEEHPAPPSHEARPAPPSQQPAQPGREQAQRPQREESSDVRNNRIQQAGGSVQKRVPDPEFREHFGRDHHFRINQPVVVAGFPRFQYSGFLFVVVDPWPAVWLDTDDFFIDFVDGSYYLCDVAHPDVLVLVAVV